MPDIQVEQAVRPRRGRPRKWPSEAARREHEAAKRRLRNKTSITPEAFDDVVRLTALADDLQRRLVGAAKELEQLRERTQELEHRFADASRPGRTIRQSPGSTAPPKMNRQQRRQVERVQRRADVQKRGAAPPP